MKMAKTSSEGRLRLIFLLIQIQIEFLFIFSTQINSQIKSLIFQQLISMGPKSNLPKEIR